MSRRNPAPRPRMAHEAYYTPGRHVVPLLARLPAQALRAEAWEPAAGAGHIATVLQGAFRSVLATDLHPPRKQLLPVAKLDFLTSRGPSGQGPLVIITNPPYGARNAQALAFLHHGLAITQRRAGVLALLLPFEFDAPRSRDALVGSHPAFAAKITIGERIRWANLAQGRNDPMSHHSWFVWAWNAAVRSALQVQGVMRTA